MNPVLTLTDRPDPKAEAAIETGLNRFNEEQAGYWDWRPLAVLAKRRGCCASVLYTISFQAPGSYQRRGYRVLGEVDCHPPGTSRIFMAKDL